MKTKAVSFSLWGSNPVYIKGALENAALIRELMPDWEMVLWYDTSVLEDNHELLILLQSIGVRTYFRPPANRYTGHFEYGMFWRFKTLDFKHYSHVIFRDLDSRITPREVDAVSQWIDSGKALHIIRDHPYHLNIHPLGKPGILGGLWGFKKPASGWLIGPMIDQFTASHPNHEYGIDQRFLQSIYDQYVNDALIHDEVTGSGIPFRIPRNGFEFIGERIDEYGRPNQGDRDCLAQHLNRINHG